MDLSFKGRAKRLDDIDLPKLGARLGVGEDELHAFIDAETLGHGFDAQGRPIILFEPHVFWRNLSGATRQEAERQGLAYKRWGTKPYPKDSYPRLRAAIAVNETAALKSASWGLGQVLGENHKLAGFETVQDMVQAMMDDEESHLEASVNFILNTGLDDELRAHKWDAFAEGYNGPGYKKNAYHIKLANAFAKWKRIKDTPWSADAPQAPQPKPAPKPVEPAKPVPRPGTPDTNAKPLPELPVRQPDDPGVDPAEKPEATGNLAKIIFVAVLAIVGAVVAFFSKG